MIEKFKGAFDVPFNYDSFDVLVGYFRASGYFAIRPLLEKIPKIRIIVGIDIDKFINEAQTKGLLYTKNEEKTIDFFLERMKLDIQTSDYTKEVENGILQLIKDIATEKIIIKAHPTKKLHAKFYILKPEGWSEHNPGSVITGSSNLTGEGLGSKAKANYEFNVLLNQFDDVLFASNEFEALWTESITILPEKISRIKDEGYFNVVTPFDLYYKMLIEYFGKSVEFDPDSIDDLPSGFKRLSYQIDAVSQGFELLKRHNGLILADVVGLGKTVIAILIAKKFFYSNGYPSHLSRILIVVPPALYKSWEDTCHKFGLNDKHIKIIHNGSLHKVTHPENYDLIIIDEAHKFRNDTSDAYDALQQLCKTPTTQILSDGTKAKKTVILVSATPLNNRPSDIRNLIYLFQDARDSTLNTVNLQSFFAKQIRDYKAVSKEKNIKIVKEKTAKIYEDIRNFIIAPLTIRRTRRDLMENSQYAEDLKAQNIVFPEAKIQTPIYYQLEPTLESLYDDTIEILKEKLTYNRYRAIAFLVGDKKAKYQTAELISKQLSRIMKTLLIKRLDSSFFAFKASLNRFLIATNVMITMFNSNKIYIAPNLPVTEYIVDERDDELLNMVTTAMETDPTIEICGKNDFATGFFDGLQNDYNLLKELNDRWKQVDEDPKLEIFCAKLEFELLNPKINQTGKLVVFSESKETTDYLYEQLKIRGYNKMLAIDANNRRDMETIITENFDANIPREQYKDDYNIIISTEVLSEGVNLHRSNVIVNYDTPWNSTKLMQRVGRVNRIGSIAEFIYVYNCYPTAKVDTDIELKKKAIQKLQAFHSAFGEDSQIYSTEEEFQSFALFDETIKEEKDERLTLLMELRKFKTDNPDDFRRIKKLSKRSRVGRKDENHHLSTVTFLRDHKRDIFYQVVEDESVKELSFIEAVAVFKADAVEPAIELHAQHHHQVNLAINDFHKVQLADAAEKSKQSAKHRMTSIDQGVVNFLASLTSIPHLGDDIIVKIKLAIEAIALGRFQNLPKKLNKLKRAVKQSLLKPDLVLDKALKIIDEYPLEENEDNGYNQIDSASLDFNTPAKGVILGKPEIIISESFLGDLRLGHLSGRP